MKVKDFVAFLKTLEQEDEMWSADYYYEDREGFSSMDACDLHRHICRPSSTEYFKHLPKNVYLLDFRSSPI